MTRLAPQSLTPLEFAKTDPILDLAVANDPISYSVGPWDNVIVQLVLVRGAWSGGQTIPLEASNDGANYSDIAPTPVSYTAVGIQAAVSVSDFRNIRLRVASATGTVGDNQVRVTVRAGQNP